MSESHVVAVSLFAALALFTTFFVTWYSLRRLHTNQMVIAVLAPIVAGASWFVVVYAARSQGWVRSDEAQFHHLYVLGVVGMPLVGVVVGLVAWFRPASSRRTRLTAWVIATIFVTPAAVGLWATHIEPQWLRVEHVQVSAASSTGPRSDTVRVGVIADIQTDAFGSYEDAAIDRLLAERPDVILVAGDMTQVDSTTYDRIRADGVAALARLDAPYGVFVIDGNTDIGAGEGVRRLALDAGLTPLIDEVVEFDVRGRAIRIGGLSWPNNQRPAAGEFVADFAESATLETIDLLLAHSPDAILNLPDREFDPLIKSEIDRSGVDLVVSGHTHGGQIALPFIGPLWNVTELPGSVAGGGLHEVDGTLVYVSTGVGVQRGESPKVRFGVRPSIGILEL